VAVVPELEPVAVPFAMPSIPLAGGSMRDVHPSALVGPSVALGLIVVPCTDRAPTTVVRFEVDAMVELLSDCFNLGQGRCWLNAA
jgi:hypothetical protein